MFLYPTPPHCESPGRRAWLVRASAASLTLSLGGCTGNDHSPRRFRVSGPSMAPTLWGPHHLAACDFCGVTFRIHAGPLAPAGATFPCWHCGAAVASPTAAGGGAPEPGDLVTLEPWRVGRAPQRIRDGLLGASGHMLRRGSLVAFDAPGGLRLKRLAALPGETVRARAGRLRVGDQPLTFAAGAQPSLVPVDFDAHRDHSRWSPSAAGERSWRRGEDRRWQGAAPANDRWLVYRHASVYDGGLAGPVRDDYPGNAGLARQLHPVEALVLEVDVRFESDGELEAAFFGSGAIPRRRVRRRGAGRTSLRFDSQETDGDDGAPPGNEPPLSPTQPVALRLIRGQAKLRRLALWRRIEYRLRRLDDRSAYPLRLARDECFVLGDNVPVSVDSREFGPLPIGEIRYWCPGSGVEATGNVVR